MAQAGLSRLKVIFWGTPEFGIPSLDAMVAAGHEIAGVVTNPDRPSGRGRALKAGPIKRWAMEAGVPVLQPDRPRGESFMEEVGALGGDISVVAAYGQILRQEVLDLPPLGSINVHASLLPKLRGAAPINWAIIRGHDQGGVTIMRMVLALDAGPMFARDVIPIGPTMTAGELYERTAAMGGDTLVRVLAAVEAGTATETPQDDDEATYAPKLDRAMARLDWSLGAAELDGWIRGCDPWPAAWTEWAGKPLQCFASAPEPSVSEAPAGVIVEADPNRGLLIGCGSGALRVGEVKPAGKRRMTAAEWIRGANPTEGASFD